MKPWRLIIESGMFHREESAPATVVHATSYESGQSPAAPLDITKALELLADARKRRKMAQEAGNLTKEVLDINNWYGGGLAVLSAVTGRQPGDLEDEMVATFGGGPVRTVPLGQMGDGTLTNGRVTMKPVERTRPKPPPGAPKPLDLDALSDEEKQELGLIFPAFVAEDDATEPEAPTITIVDLPPAEHESD